MIVIPDRPGELGPLDEKQIEEVYARLSSLRIELDANPLELGPGRLNEKISAARTLLSSCEDVFSVISQALHRYRRSLRKAEADYKLQYRHLLTNDVEVRGGRASSDREAIAATKLRTEVDRLEVLRGAVEDLEAVMVVVRAKRDDLKDVQRRLRDQQQMCREEISLGSRWGSAPRGSRPPTGESARPAPADEVGRMMEDYLVRGGGQEPEPKGPPPQEIAGVGFDGDYDALLGMGDPPPAAPPVIVDEGLEEVLSAFARRVG